MGRWTRQEIEETFDRYQAAALKGAQTGDWRDWADCFTEDATYNEHHFGKMWGRERIFNWISETMKPFPVNQMKAFPVTWYSIDVEKGWIFCEVMNRMADLNDGEVYQEPNVTILHYAGNGLFKYEEDAYNPANMGKTVGRWLAAKKAQESAAKTAEG
ncbi:MAG: nuclear transport factor 2 family protein [Pseudomonadales bacterium]